MRSFCCGQVAPGEAPPSQPMSNRGRKAGGAAAAGGMDFQHRVAAWFAVRILAEQNVSPPWDIPAPPEFLRCETDQPVDDLLVGTSDLGCIFVQVKKTLSLFKKPDSDFASTLNQCVRQFIHCREQTTGGRPWERPLNPTKDRLVVVTGPDSSAPIRVHLPATLDRLRGLAAGQPIDDAAANVDEQQALRFVVGHIKSSWKRALGVVASEDEIRQTLSLIRFHELNVETGDVDEREAKDLLRMAVVHDPGQADATWAQLITSCARFAVERSGADRRELQQILLNAGIMLQAVRSYRSDIERVKWISQKTCQSLATLSHIQIGQTEIKIQRVSTEKLRSLAGEGSFLVVGEPGAGKSGALHDFVQVLENDGRDVVFLAADRLAATSSGTLRVELGLEHELADVLANWPGGDAGFLVVDALDAARAATSARTLRELIQRVIEAKGRWHVVASIRKFDLRYSQELRNLFQGDMSARLGPELRDQEFAGIHHLNVPRLSDEELAQIQPQSSALHTVISSAPVELHQLLRVPFNLRLVAELLATGVDPAELTPIRTQLELLDRYWFYRVIRDDKQGDAREAVLRAACQRMVETRSLRVERDVLGGAAASVALDDLLSSQVLMEWQSSPSGAAERYILTFCHHVLFDYAVARLLLRGDPARLVNRLGGDPELALTIRPSLLFHLRYLWTVGPGHELFWKVVLQIAVHPQIPEIGKLIGPLVAGDLARSLVDLGPLCEALASSDDAKRTGGEQALRSLVGSLVTAASAGQPLQGPGAGPWCDLLDHFSSPLRAAVAYPIRTLLATLCEHPEAFTPEQRAAAGRSGRRLLEFAWAQAPRDPWLIIHALQGVCRTFESDPIASKALLRRCLDPEHLARYGYEEIPRLASEVKRVIPLDAEFVAEIYRAVFRHWETSDEPTPMGASRIIPMTSNKGQDFRMAWHQLAEIYPNFLAQAPVHATRALISALDAYVVHEHPIRSNELIEEGFEFGGQPARIRTDYSAIWDAGNVYDHDEQVKMLNALDHHLEQLAGHEESAGKLQEIVEVLARENHFAVVWRRLLRLGARFPRTLCHPLRPLGWAKPILAFYDTSSESGEFLRAVFPLLLPDERERVEQVVLSLPDAMPLERREHGERARNRLLGCLKLDDLVTDEARTILAGLQSASAVPSNEPRVQFEGPTWGPYGEEEFLADAGVPVQAEANRRIRDLEAPVKEFVDRHLNSIPQASDTPTILPVLRILRDALDRADADGVHPKQRDHAWGILAGASARLARIENLPCEEEAGALTREILLATSLHPVPSHDPERDAQFDESPSWASPAARIESAEGLTLFARHATCATEEVLRALERLSKDPAPSVRLQVANHLCCLYQTAPQTMWSILERLAREDPSRGILQFLLAHTLNPLSGSHPDRVVSLAKGIFDRVVDGPGAEKVRGFCVDIFTGLYVWRDHLTCREILLGIAAAPVPARNEAERISFDLRDVLCHGPVDPSDPNEDAVRGRAWDLIERILRSARRELHQIKEAHKDMAFTAWPKPDQEMAQSAARLIDHVGMQIYFASGAFDGKKKDGTGLESLMTLNEKRRFYNEVRPVLDELSDESLPSLTHHLLEMLEVFIPIDPSSVFLRIGRVLRSGKESGYQYESLGADLFVKLVERYLAEYRQVFQEIPECRQTLLEALDIFVQAGWPSAQRLTYQLDQIFR